MKDRSRVAIMLFALVALGFTVSALVQSRSSDELLGFWDMGVFERRALRDPQPISSSQLATLIGTDLLHFNPAESPLKGRNTSEIFKNYGLDESYFQRARRRSENQRLSGRLENLDIAVPLSGDP